MIKTNIECENIYKNWEVDYKKFVENANQIFQFYLNDTDITSNCCLKNYEYNLVSFDFLLCDGIMTHKVNKEYRNKDYVADIITFAVFADSSEDDRFILDGEINLGEIIIALDKITEMAEEKSIKKEDELLFFVSHGILHLLGFDHQSEEDYNFVIEKQKKALQSIGIVYDKI